MNLLEMYTAKQNVQLSYPPQTMKTLQATSPEHKWRRNMWRFPHFILALCACSCVSQMNDRFLPWGEKSKPSPPPNAVILTIVDALIDSSETERN